MASHKEAFDALAGAIDPSMPADRAADLIRSYGDAVKRGILGDDLNPSELVLHANGYRWLAAEIHTTMADPDRWDGDGAEEALLAEYVRELAAEVEKLRGLVGDFVDPGQCWYDHHGYCQEHSWFSVDPRCPHARAKELGLLGED